MLHSSSCNEVEDRCTHFKLVLLTNCTHSGLLVVSGIRAAPSTSCDYVSCWFGIYYNQGRNIVVHYIDYMTYLSKRPLSRL